VEHAPSVPSTCRTYGDAALKVLDFVSSMTELREFCNVFAIPVASIIPCLRADQCSKLLVNVGTYTPLLPDSRTRLQVTQLLLANGADVHYDDGLPLRTAARRGWVEAVHYLLENGADACAAEDAAICHAAASGHEIIVDALISAGADVNARDGFPLRGASHNGHAAAVRVLTQRDDVDVHAPEEAEDDALMWAIVAGHDDIVAILIEAGADVHARDDEVLEHAVSCATNGDLSRIRVIELVLQGDVFTDHIKTIALRKISKCKQFVNLEKILDALTGAGAKIGPSMRRNMLSTAITNGDDAHVKLLLTKYECKADLSDVIRALSEGHATIIDMLLDHQAISAHANDLVTHAARFGHARLLEFVIHKLTFRQFLYVASDAYLAAVYHRHLDAVRILMAKSDRNLEEGCGWDGLQSAARNGDVPMCNAILRDQAIRYRRDPDEFIFVPTETRMDLIGHVNIVRRNIDKIAYRALCVPGTESPFL
jgi:ankyrin repeat protein